MYTTTLTRLKETWLSAIMFWVLVLFHRAALQEAGWQWMDTRNTIANHHISFIFMMTAIVPHLPLPKYTSKKPKFLWIKFVFARNLMQYLHTNKYSEFLIQSQNCWWISTIRPTYLNPMSNFWSAVKCVIYWTQKIWLFNVPATLCVGQYPSKTCKTIYIVSSEDYIM